MSIKQSQLDNFSFIELAGFLPDGRMLRDKFVRFDDTEAISKWRDKFGNIDVFTSICRYAKPEAQSQYIVPLFFDIDSLDNLNAARENALILCELIMARLQIDSNLIQICFSGYKGFHVTVPCEIFNSIPSKFAIELNKRIALEAQTQGVPLVDTSVYTSRRLWRLINSINSKSGLHKIPLTHKELLHLSIGNILKLAQKPRIEDDFCITAVNPQAALWYKTTLSCMANFKGKPVRRKTTFAPNFKHGWQVPRCIKNIRQTTLPDGIRHNAYLSLARFYSWINMHPNEVCEQLFELDQKNPIHDPDSIQRIVTWAMDHPGFAGCDNDVLKKYCNKENCFYHHLKSARKKRDNHSTSIASTGSHQADRPEVINPFSSEAD